MFPTRAALSKASRLPLISKHANKDYYKGNRASSLPGGPRTGAPGRHQIRGKAKYTLDDRKVRVFVAPPLEVLNSTPLKPYVSTQVRLTRHQKEELYGRFPAHGFDGQHYLDMYRALHPRGRGGGGAEGEGDRVGQLSLYEQPEVTLGQEVKVEVGQEGKPAQAA
ncbi:hypothetical protein CALCODRAFT_489863 [Calocera cornea HHB12733]|uniref:Uncharacterized protein n=1 Tax=Calocera cornea HHB12733 TaxID=1353952 RepID=A0A165K025_9BASI|nr:hypothetical protein CALCODRAFT_489863 [Calocera cornea HHB12733]